MAIIGLLMLRETVARAQPKGGRPENLVSSELSAPNFWPGPDLSADPALPLIATAMQIKAGGAACNRKIVFG
jgi:hypothetical protein